MHSPLVRKMTVYVIFDLCFYQVLMYHVPQQVFLLLSFLVYNALLCAMYVYVISDTESQYLLRCNPPKAMGVLCTLTSIMFH